MCIASFCPVYYILFGTKYNKPIHCPKEFPRKDLFICHSKTKYDISFPPRPFTKSVCTTGIMTSCSIRESFISVWTSSPYTHTAMTRISPCSRNQQGQLVDYPFLSLACFWRTYKQHILRHFQSKAQRDFGKSPGSREQSKDMCFRTNSIGIGTE